MKKSIIYCAIALFAAASCGKEAPAPAQRWSEERANAWYAEQEWPVGFNYVAATAINQFEMWQAESFDPKTIDYEMSKAEELGFNTVRIFLHDMVWEADPAGFKQRIDAFLGICRSHGIKAIVTFFTNGGRFENPQLGKQPESIQGIHNSQWIQSPGAPSVNDPASWPRLERYVKDILTTFRDDWFEYDPDRQELIGVGTGRRFRLGQAVTVRLTDVHIGRLEVNLELEGTTDTAKRSSSRRSAGGREAPGRSSGRKRNGFVPRHKRR